MVELYEDQRRGVQILGLLSALVLLGLTISGLWQFFTHQWARSWLGYDPVTGFRQQGTASEGGAAVHGYLADLSVMLALAGTAWLAYRILHRIPLVGVAAFLLLIAAQITGSLIRFNLVKLEGRNFAEANDGYAQIFGGDLEYVVTDSYDLGPASIRLLTLSHVATVPILMAAVWLALRSRDLDTGPAVPRSRDRLSGRNRAERPKAQ